VDPFASHRCDGPGAEQGALVGVGKQPKVGSRVLLVCPGAGKRRGEVELNRVEVCRSCRSAWTPVRPTAATSGSVNTTRGMPW
jgi:hypothetical protein